MKWQGLFTCSVDHLQQDTQPLCPERHVPLGEQVWPEAGLGGASLVKHTIRSLKHSSQAKIQTLFCFNSNDILCLPLTKKPHLHGLQQIERYRTPFCLAAIKRINRFAAAYL